MSIAVDHRSHSTVVLPKIPAGYENIWLDLTESAKAGDVHYDHVRRLIRQGSLTPRIEPRRGRRTPFVSAADLVEWFGEECCPRIEAILEHRPRAAHRSSVAA